MNLKNFKKPISHKQILNGDLKKKFCFEIPCSIQRWFDEIFLKSVLQKFNWKTIRICQMAQIANIEKLGRRRHLACTQIHNFLSCKIDILKRKTNFPINMISFWFILGSRWALYQSGFSSSLIFLIHILSWPCFAFRKSEFNYLFIQIGFFWKISIHFTVKNVKQLVQISSAKIQM